MRLLNKRLDYAFSALQYIKQVHPRPVMAQEMARELSVSRKYLSRVLRTLVEGSIISSRFGPKGGYTLARKPREVSFLHILEVLGSAPIIAECLGGNDEGTSRCRLERGCTHKKVWGEVDREIRRILARANLADL